MRILIYINWHSLLKKVKLYSKIYVIAKSSNRRGGDNDQVQSLIEILTSWISSHPPALLWYHPLRGIPKLADRFFVYSQQTKK